VAAAKAAGKGIAASVDATVDATVMSCLARVRTEKWVTRTDLILGYVYVFRW